MQGLNKILLMGRLGSTPHIQATKNGKSFTGLSIATHRNRNTADGDGSTTSETTDWHYVRVWGTQAETCAKYLTKGQPVLVEGYLSHFSQSKENGETEKKTGINALRVDFLPRNNSHLPSSNPYSPSSDPQPEPN